MLHLCKSRFLLLKSKKLFAPTFEAESKKRPHPTEDVTAFPLGEGVAQPTEEVTAFPLGEGVGTADENSFPPRGEWRAAPREVPVTK